MGKVKKYKGLRSIAASLRPIILKEEHPVYFPGWQIKKEGGKLRTALLPTWGAELIDALTDKTEYIVGYNITHRVQNHYDIMKDLIIGCNEQQAIKKLDDYVALYQHKNLNHDV